jgi:hypothetical protein
MGLAALDPFCAALLTSMMVTADMVVTMMIMPPFMPVLIAGVVAMPVPIITHMPVVIVGVPVVPRIFRRLERYSDLRPFQPVCRHQRLDLRPLLQPDAIGEDLHR